MRVQPVLRFAKRQEDMAVVRLQDTFGLHLQQLTAGNRDDRGRGDPHRLFQQLLDAARDVGRLNRIVAQATLASFSVTMLARAPGSGDAQHPLLRIEIDREHARSR